VAPLVRFQGDDYTSARNPEGTSSHDAEVLRRGFRCWRDPYTCYTAGSGKPQIHRDHLALHVIPVRCSLLRRESYTIVCLTSIMFLCELTL
jgi:hypothetical protein